MCLGVSCVHLRDLMQMRGSILTKYYEFLLALIELDLSSKVQNNQKF